MLAGVVWFDGGEELTGARVSAGAKLEPERKFPRERETTGKGDQREALCLPKPSPRRLKAWARPWRPPCLAAHALP